LLERDRELEKEDRERKEESDMAPGGPGGQRCLGRGDEYLHNREINDKRN